MSASKITQVHVYIFGFVVMILVGVGMYFGILKPMKDANVALAAQVQQAESATVSVDNQNFNWTQIKQAEEKLAAARVRRAGKERKMASMEAGKILPRSQEINLGDGTDQTILQTTMPRWLELPRRVVTTMERFGQARARRRDVQVTTAFTAPAPSTRPGDIPRDIIAWRLGAMTITGRFERVMQWAKDWNDAPLVVSVEDLKCSLAGRDGEVEATASLVVYIFPTGEAVQKPGAAPAGGTPGGMPGGMPGAFPGGDMGAPAGAAGNGPGAAFSPAPPS